MQRHRFVSGCPAGRKTFAMWLISMVSMATILMESRDMVKTPFVFIVKYEGAGVKIAAERQHFCGPLFLLPCACAIMKHRESYKDGKTATQLCRKGRTFPCAGHLLCAGVCDRAVCVRYYDKRNKNPRCAGTQPEKHRRRCPLKQNRRHCGRVRVGQIVAGPRRAVCRGSRRYLDALSTYTAAA